MDDESRNPKATDRTWLWLVLGLLFVAAVGASLWLRQPPRNSVALTDVENIETQLKREGFVSTNSVRFHSEAVFFMIPVSKIFGTGEDSVNDTLIRDGATLGINYEIKGMRAFNFSLPTDPLHTERARKVAEELAKLNPTVTVTIWTNEVGR